jgi:BirA family biotin operon repressor/biotin-[acetyl-CoA-carboxylase] ligase
VALHEVASAYAPDAGISIKWPNDLVAGGAKLAGILLERSGDAVVAGFGMNLAYFPDDTPVPACSLHALTGTAPDPDAIVSTLADSFAGWTARWRANGLGPICARWLACAHPIGTALSAASADGRRIEGVFDGLDRDGALRLRLADGSVHVIQAGDIFLI